MLSNKTAGETDSVCERDAALDMEGSEQERGGTAGPLLTGVDGSGPDGQILAQMSLENGQIGSDAGPCVWGNGRTKCRGGRNVSWGRTFGPAC
jgi:hypothetical protein